MVYRVGIARIERVWKGPAGVGQYQVRSNIAVPGTLTASAPQHRVGRPCTDFAVVDVDPKIIARLVELAVSQPVSLALVGGCLVAIVDRWSVDDFSAHVEREYYGQTGIEPRVFAVEASPGAGPIGSD